MLQILWPCFIHSKQKKIFIQARCHSILLHLLLICVFFIRSSICSVSYFLSFSHHTWIAGVGPDLRLSPGSGVKLWGGAARCIFPRSKPWLCMGSELGGLQSGTRGGELRVNISEWMPASFSTGSFQPLSRFCRFLVSLCLFVCFGGGVRDSFWGSYCSKEKRNYKQTLCYLVAVY